MISPLSESPAPDVSPAESARRGRLIAFLVAAAFFMENLDATVITTAVPAMAQSFGVLPVNLSIGISAYLLPPGVFKPQLHVMCKDALVPVQDDLPHFTGFPASLGGSDEAADIQRVGPPMLAEVGALAAIGVAA